MDRAAARGHRSHEAERREKRRRDDRQRAIRHVMAALASGTKGRVDEESVRKGIDILQQIDPDEVRAVRVLSREDILARAGFEDYREFILAYPELENDAERNPFWYHAG